MYRQTFIFHAINLHSRKTFNSYLYNHEFLLSLLFKCLNTLELTPNICHKFHWEVGGLLYMEILNPTLHPLINISGKVVHESASHKPSR